MNVSYISSKAVIYQWLSETGRSLDFNEDMLATQIMDALGLMEYKAALKHAVTVLNVKNYKAKFPKGLKKLDIVMYNSGAKKVGQLFIHEAIIPTFDGDCDYKITRDCPEDTDCGGVVISHKPLIDSLIYPFSSKFKADNVDTGTSWVPMHPKTGSFDMNKYHLRDCNTATSDEMSKYGIDNGYITTNFPEGQLLVAYFTLNLDDDGYVFVPDDSRIITALIAYLEFRQAFREYRSNKTRENKMFHDDAKQTWYSKIASARSSYLLSEVDVEEISRVLVNLYKFDHPEHFWKDYTKSYA